MFSLLAVGAALLHATGCSTGPSSTSSNPITPIPPVPTATTVTADFSTWVDSPLLKDKIGVYQTPFMGTVGIAPPTAMQPFLTEAGVRDIRYETGWGKPDTYAYDQIGGTASSPVVDFTRFDPVMTMFQAAKVQPLLAVGYNPLPLETCTSAGCWEAPPSNYSGWSSVLQQYSNHYANVLGLSGVQYEMWNEPDIASGGSKIFFTGSQSDYASVYKNGVVGVLAGAPQGTSGRDALVGGPAIAYDTTYITQTGLLQQPFDFLSIHGYANYSSQIGSLRSVATGTGPLYLTEYASYTTSGINLANSLHAGAQAFMADAMTMMNDPDVAKVYWAQWIDDSLGMITYNLHRKAIFNAYKIYETMLPVDRSPVTVSSSSSGISGMAAEDPHTAGFAVLNSGTTAQNVVVNLSNLPFTTGKLTQWYIDGTHASYEDNASENLTTGGDSTQGITAGSTTWTGTIQAQSMIYLHATDGSADLLTPNRIGTYGGDHFYFSTKPSSAYADFDPATSIARVGMGTAASGTVMVGNVYDLAVSTVRLAASVTKSGPFASSTNNSVFGLRVDYMNTSGNYSKSVLYTDGLYNAGRTLAPTWGTGKAAVDLVHTYSGSSVVLTVAADAPSDWNGKRVIITPLIGDAGAASRARIQLTIAP
jgi:hypothetical protein